MARKKQRKKKGSPLLGWLQGLLAPGISVGLGWILAFTALLAFLAFQPVVKTAWDPVVPPRLILVLFVAGLALMVRGYQSLPPGKAPDLGRRPAWILLGLVMAAGAFLRLYRLQDPPGTFWDDWATVIVWVHTILDKDHFFWMLPTDGIEPFVPYVDTLFQSLLPDSVPDYIVPRLASTLVDMAALWLIYLCGKELGSRRAGLAAAALGALGRPMIQLSLTGMRAYSLSLAVTFLLLASLKLLRKPTPGHFLLWGLALAFGVHTYSSFRVFMIAGPLLLLPWALRNLPPPRFLSGLAAVGSLFLLAGVYSGTFTATSAWFAPWNKLWGQWVTWQPKIIVAFFLFTLLPAVLAVRMSLRRASLSRLAGWALGVGAACLLIFPLTLSPEFDGRMAVLSPFQNGDTASHPLAFLAQQLHKTFLALFYACQDRNDLAIAADPFYDLFSQGGLLFGLAFCLCAFDWRKVFLLAMGGLGVVVYVISLDPASTKLIGSAPPLYLLAGWGFSRLWDGLFPRQPKGRTSWGPLALSLVLGTYALWGGWIQQGKLFGYWARIPGPDSVLAHNIRQDAGDHRTYIAPSPWFYGRNAQFVLNEGKRYYILKASNLIPLAEGGVPEDTILYVFGPDKDRIQALQKDYPGAQWEKLWVHPHDPGDPNLELYLWRVSIPGASIAAAGTDLLRPAMQKGEWLRRYYSAFYGWGLSGILYEERVEGLSTPLPVQDLRSSRFPYPPSLIRCVGPLRVDREGDFEWSVENTNPVWLRVDGRTLWKKDDPLAIDKTTGKVHWAAGEHRVELMFRSTNGYLLPEVLWRRVGTGPWTRF